MLYNLWFFLFLPEGNETENSVKFCGNIQNYVSLYLGPNRNGRCVKNSDW
jgi:hypothetical protein